MTSNPSSKLLAHGLTRHMQVRARMFLDPQAINSGSSSRRAGSVFFSFFVVVSPWKNNELLGTAKYLKQGTNSLFLWLYGRSSFLQRRHQLSFSVHSLLRIKCGLPIRTAWLLWAVTKTRLFHSYCGLNTTTICKYYYIYRTSFVKGMLRSKLLSWQE